ncbi:YggS family pyridoxal phosphate-dependent enzyme [Sphingomonas sp. HDW15A]|uniref:YggS family pyridoxal phosphate-dependent enzyme n=1 Tax=Sphingomonas sp. HDW15A TaxID=2714942 RepID=UPI00140B6DDD|nr:YggS family pyridoxal phosphate-dependent enzyme [Sphingomonas sp. HDW15A]QIK96953.1 YggS family pyridoxal phosphate-dependent enzyme [Sphingomonas sp. HDW15A]
MTSAERLQQIRERIARAAKASDRDPSEITLIAVSKTRSVADIEELISAGQRDFGESRVQEAADKWPGLRKAHPDIRLHMIGRLQSNKAAEAVALFDTIHSLDRPSLLGALAATGQPTPCFVQVNIGAEAQKGGVAISELGAFIEEVRQSSLRLKGLMALPPLGQQPGPYFALLAKLARRHDVTGLSMGMSADYETAVMLGATHVRVGSALFAD